MKPEAIRVSKRSLEPREVVLDDTDDDGPESRRGRQGLAK